MKKNFVLKTIIVLFVALLIIIAVDHLLFPSNLNSGDETTLEEGLSYLSELENRDVATINKEILALNSSSSDNFTDTEGNTDDASIIVDISETDEISTDSAETDTSELITDSSESDASNAEGISESEPTTETTAAETTVDEAAAAMLTSWQEQITSGNITVLTEEERASYRSRLSSCAVIGDSMAQAALEYGFLDSSHVFYRRGYAIGQLGDAISEAAAMLPSTVIFFTGLNDTDYYAEPADYAAAYLEKIQETQSLLPNATIYVCSMLPPSNALGAVRADLARAPLYDEALKSMCEANGINYIDITWMVNQSLYMADGIHFISEFYDIWIQYVAYCTGL